MFSRRTLVTGALASLPTVAFAQDKNNKKSPCRPGSRPAEASLRSADLIWTALPGQFVPFSDGGEQEDAAFYIRERDLEVKDLRDRGQTERADMLAKMEFPEFRARMTHGVDPGAYRTYSDGWLGVGHVAIAERDQSGILWIIEAVRTGVRRVTYDDWLEGGRGGVSVGALCYNMWQGRPQKPAGGTVFRDLTSEECQSVVDYAAEQARLMRPYRLFRAGLLTDATSFFCSKLAWLAIFKGAGFAFDGDTNDDRDIFQVSPKKMLENGKAAGTLKVLHSPGEYGSRQTK